MGRGDSNGENHADLNKTPRFSGALLFLLKPDAMAQDCFGWALQSLA